MTEPFPDHFSAVAGSYARHRPSYPDPLVDFLAALAPRRAVAWDAGCGSGQLSRLLTRAFERVVATDASRDQIAAAAPHPRVGVAVARAEASGLASGAVDLAVSAQAAHWFDLDAYYAEVRRVAAPGAAVALVCYGLMECEAEAHAVIRRFHLETLRPYWPDAWRHVLGGYRALAFPFREIAPPPLSIVREWTAADVLAYMDTWSAVRNLEAAGRRDLFDSFARALAGAWGAPDTRRRVRWPLTVRAGRV